MIPSFETVSNSIGSVVLPPLMSLAESVEGEDCLFGKIAEWESSEGALEEREILDAGTGVHSLRWISSLPSKRWAAISASEEMTLKVSHHPLIAQRTRPGLDRILLGHWGDEGLLEGQLFDVVIADYLIGSVDGFEPYTQDTIIERLSRLLKRPAVEEGKSGDDSQGDGGVRKEEEEEVVVSDDQGRGGRLYIVGMEPLPDHAKDPGEELVCEMRRLRDAAILLAGHRCYREYPLSFILRQCKKAGLVVHHHASFSILHSRDSFRRQCNVGRSKLTLMPEGFRGPMRAAFDELEAKFDALLSERGVSSIPLSFDYVVQAGFPSSV
jgi:hypothetical protein